MYFYRIAGRISKMKKISTTITLEPEIKEKAMKILESRGMKLSSVIELYLRKLIEEEQNANTTNSK